MKTYCNSRILISVMVLLSVVLFSSAVYGDSYVVPAAPDAVGASCVYTGCNNYNHAQQLFEGSAFIGWTGPKLITQIAFRRNPQLTPNAFSLQFSNVEFSMSTTQVDAATMAGGGAINYAANRGPDVTVVRSGPLALASPSSGDTGEQPFDIVVEFTTPYLYDPSAGNLLLEWKNLGGDIYWGSYISFDSGAVYDPILVANMNDNYGPESTYASTWGLSATITEFTTASADPAEMLNEIVNTVISLNLQQGISNSLDAKLDSAISALDDMNDNNDIAAINSLNAFINAVEAQRGNKISEEDADTLIAAAYAIIDKLEAEY